MDTSPIQKLPNGTNNTSLILSSSLGIKISPMTYSAILYVYVHALLLDTCSTDLEVKLSEFLCHFLDLVLNTLEIVEFWAVIVSLVSNQECHLPSG